MVEELIQHIMKLQRNILWKFIITVLLLFPLTFLFFNLSKTLLIETTPSLSTTESESCQPGRPCSYNDKVDLRVIVLTYNRSFTLLKLLETVDALELDRQSAALEIWIDRDRKTGTVDAETVKVASKFKWRGGPTRVHIHRAHVGIYGQWIDTWRPRDDSDDELALFLEDDSSVSKYAYRWIRAVFHTYSHRIDFAGASLTSYQRKTFSDKLIKDLAGPKNHTVMMYKGFESWGFAPKPKQWIKFQVCLEF